MTWQFTRDVPSYQHLSGVGRQLCCASVVMSVACARTESVAEVLSRRGTPPAVEGCYVLAAGDDAKGLRKIRAFRLDLRPLGSEHSERHPASSLVDSAGAWASEWSADSLSDTVRVSIGDGFDGVDVIVAPSPGGLRGRAVKVSDARPSEWNLGEVAYVKQSCIPNIR